MREVSGRVFSEYASRTSFDERALLVKSLQHVLKHLSTIFEYIFKKSCICPAVSKG